MGFRKTNGGSAKPMDTPAFYAVLVTAGIAVVVGAIFVGRSDSGVINVSATINDSNQKNIEAGGDPSNNVGTASEALRSMPNGGLVPQGAPSTPPQEAPSEEVIQDSEQEGDQASSTVSSEQEEGGESTDVSSEEVTN